MWFRLWKPGSWYELVLQSSTLLDILNCFWICFYPIFSPFFRDLNDTVLLSNWNQWFRNFPLFGFLFLKFVHSILFTDFLLVFSFINIANVYAHTDKTSLKHLKSAVCKGSLTIYYYVWHFTNMQKSKYASFKTCTKRILVQQHLRSYQVCYFVLFFSMHIIALIDSRKTAIQLSSEIDF